MWISKKANYGNQIRVFRGLYYHHGIYESDDCVYQFASPEGFEIAPETAIICITTLEKFLNGGELEVRQYTEEELKRKRSDEEIIEFAKSKVGSNMGGYDVFTNNCEHFSNLCAFGVSDSEQSTFLMAMLGGIFK
ncbi:MAG: lecithin retinol acyltransferase family protein [Acholeplasmatales bacterium]|nr:lecithin retinol acyltransferase family protein [Acholeplasmatales bacterium]